VDETGFCKFAGSLGDLSSNMAPCLEVLDLYASKNCEMPKGYTAAESYFLFLQEQIKGIIIRRLTLSRLSEMCLRATVSNSLTTP
jgi:hypothetical protein